MHDETPMNRPGQGWHVTLGHPPSAQPRFFYGWVIVGVMAAAGGLTMALGALNFGLFIKPMGDELGVGRAIFGWAQSARQVTSAVTALLVGPLLDRFGARVMLAVAALITGGAWPRLAFVDEGWQVIAFFALMGVVGMSGPGALVTTVPVTKWFVRKRGKAMAFSRWASRSAACLGAAHPDLDRRGRLASCLGLPGRHRGQPDRAARR